MTPNQKSAILKKIGRPEGFNLPYHPKELRPYLLTIFNALDRLSTSDASRLMDALFSLYALDRNSQPYSENWVREKEDCFKVLKEVLKDKMIPQVCEKCGIGEDSQRFDKARVCQDCINNMKVSDQLDIIFSE